MSHAEWTAQEDQRALQAEVRGQLQISHRRAKEIILRGGVSVDGHSVTDPGFRVKSGQKLLFNIDWIKIGNDYNLFLQRSKIVFLF